MRNLFFALAFMLMGTFAFANSSGVKTENSVANDTEVTADNKTVSDSAEILSEKQKVQDDTLIVIVYPDGTVVVIIIRD